VRPELRHLTDRVDRRPHGQPRLGLPSSPEVDSMRFMCPRFVSSAIRFVPLIVGAVFHTVISLNHPILLLIVHPVV
jgi:hypothetical protein